MKYLTTYAFAAALVGIASMAACSSGSDNSDSGGGAPGAGSPGAGAPGAGAPGAGAPGAGSPGAGAPSAGAPAGGASTGGASGAPAGGASTAGSAGASAGAGGAHAGAGGTSGGGAGGTSGGAGAGAGGTSGSAGAGGGSNAVVATCGAQTYTPSTTAGASCTSTIVPAAKLVSDFETAAAGWGVYPNVDGMTGFVPATATPSAGGANSTTKSLAFVVTSLTQGIKIQVGFGHQCQDVRTFTGLSFWAKGTIDAATAPFAVDANTLVLFMGSEKTALGGCTTGCSTAPNDRRVTITSDWKEYRIPFGCFGDATSFDGYYTSILFNAFGSNSNFAIDQVGYY